MNNKFDKLTRSMAQSVTRRSVLKNLTVGLAGMAAAWFALSSNARAQSACLPSGYGCRHDSDCCSGVCRLYKIGGKLNTKACA